MKASTLLQQFLGGLLFLSSISVAGAIEQGVESTGTIEEIDFFGDIPVINSATRLAQKITDVPAAITLISREQIEASGATEVPQLLKLVPGFLSYYIVGNQFGVTNKGYTVDFPGDLEIMIDGRSVYEPTFSTVEWSSLGITVEDIEYIEVVRGSNAPAYGSNAFLGAVNIVTATPLQANGTQSGITVGDLQTRNGWLRYSGEMGAVNYRLGITYRNNEGFPALSNQEPEESWHQIEDENEALHFNLSGIYAASLRDSVTFQLGGGESRVHLPDDDPLAADQGGFNIRDFKNNYQLLRWTRSLADENEVSLQFYHNRLEITELRELGFISDILGVAPSLVPFIIGRPDEFLVTGLDGAISERYDLEFQNRLRLNEQQRLVWGLAARHDRVRSEFLLSRRGTVDETGYRLFGNWEYQPSNEVLINLGLMAEENNIAGAYISPRAAVNYYLQPLHAIRAGITQGNRTPSVLEANQMQAVRFADGTLIDADVTVAEGLDKSTVTEYEIGYLGEFRSGQISIDVRLFRSEIDDLISEYSAPFSDFSGTIAVISNSLNWVTKGFDTQIKWRPAEGTLISLQYAYTDMEGTRIRTIDPFVIREVDEHLPRHNFSLLASQKLPGDIGVSLAWYQLSGFDWRQGDETERQDRLDLRLAKDFGFGRQRAKVELIAHNLLDDYLDYDENNVFETRVFLRFRLEFP